VTHAADTFDPTTFVEYEGAFYPKNSMGPEGVPAPLSPEVAGLVREIIEAELEANPEARRIWIAEAERVARKRKRGAA
jgi:hypothetical protein